MSLLIFIAPQSRYRWLDNVKDKYQYVNAEDLDIYPGNPFKQYMVTNSSAM
jgi:hypothetical protein